MCVWLCIIKKGSIQKQTSNFKKVTDNAFWTNETGKEFLGILWSITRMGGERSFCKFWYRYLVLQSYGNWEEVKIIKRTILFFKLNCDAPRYDGKVWPGVRCEPTLSLWQPNKNLIWRNPLGCHRGTAKSRANQPKIWITVSRRE